MNNLMENAMRRSIILGVAALLGQAAPVAAAEPTAAEILKKYDDTMSPKTFDALVVMIAHRQDDTTRTYKFRVMKGHDDKIRLWFFEPASAKGQEMLRVGENMWVYMPSLKRAVRIASRDSFQGGDFNNADALRVNYVADYTPVLGDSGDPKSYLLDLSAKSKDAAYDKVKLWFRKGDLMPEKAEYYAASGKMIRSMKFTDVKDFRGLRRPAHLEMKNELAQKRWSEMTWLDMKLNVEVPAQRFVVDDLGR
ncbi:MAG: outer membrane lipoprotein-sorting protein [Myxococcales bacterium]|nr:outer membrane lipoprotein-sorting protein [Myxococcales bacterium]